jgi:hypothetical protein
MAGGIDVQVIYDPDSANLDITNKVIFRTAKLTTSLATLPGTWSATVKDVDRVLDFSTGKRIVWKLDGVVFYAGFITQISRAFAFPADDTSVLSDVKSRQFVLRGVDYNILFDKRVLRNTANYLVKIPNYTRSYDGVLVNYLCDHYLDLPTWLDTSTEVVNVAYMPTKTGTTFRWTTQGNPWRTQMDIFAKKAGTTYYIRPYGTGARLVYKALEDSAYPYAFSDKPVGSEIGFRELDYMEDASGMVNDALVWGGDEFGDNSTGAATVFARDKNDTSITDHGRWQWAETHFGDTNYASQEEVTQRAEAIVQGRTGDTIYEQNRGLQNPNKTYRMSWFNRGVPESGGVADVIMPSELATLKLHVFGDGVDPLIVVLPCRQVDISFVSNDPTGASYVRFDGTFSLQANDPWQLWLAIKRRQRAVE